MRVETIELKNFYPQIAETGANPTLELMIQEGEKLRPLVFILPGGGYSMTARGEGQNVGMEFLPIGCNVAVLHYSVAPFTYPTQLIEVACGLDYIINREEELKCDKEKIAISGFSAGGHLAACYCTIRNNAEVLEKFPNPHPVQAAILGYPCIYFNDQISFALKNLTGKEEPTVEDIERLSVNKYVKNGLTPPTFIFMSAADTILETGHTLEYGKALSKEKIPFELHILPFGYHGLSTSNYGTVEGYKDKGIAHFSSWCELARKWLRLTFDF